MPAFAKTANGYRAASGATLVSMNQLPSTFAIYDIGANLAH
jgi:hypothetical protein